MRKFILATLWLTLLPNASLATSMHEGHHMNPSQPPETIALKHLDPRLPTPATEDLEAAFPDLGGMDMRHHMKTPLFTHVLVDNFEAGHIDGQTMTAWDISGWVGYDYQRLWFRSEGERLGPLTENSEVTLLYGRSTSRWWDTLIGLRHDFKPSESQTFLAIGVQGLAPYWFEVQLTGYVGERGQFGARLDVEYEQLITQKLILQPSVEVNLWGKDDVSRDIGKGISNAELGVRLRYEIVREFAPYIGFSWNWKLGNTGNIIEANQEPTKEATWLLGFRAWY